MGVVLKLRIKERLLKEIMKNEVVVAPAEMSLDILTAGIFCLQRSVAEQVYTDTS